MSGEEIRNSEAPEKLEQGTYEIIRNRLNKHGDVLRDKLNALNGSRKEIFGAIDTALLTTERITTENKCIPRDMIALGDDFVFGYNVHIGLRTTTELNDVFSVFHYQDHGFQAKGLELIKDARFKEDFNELYKYYKNTTFSRFLEIGPFVFMVFQVGKDVNDIKAFKWKRHQNKLQYVDNRSEHEVVPPDQYEFSWKRTKRDMYRSGLHPHISIEDKVFVETIGGDLTIKMEDNTDEGKGIYSEPVEYVDQTLDDAEIFYALVGNLVFLKIKPYKEEKFRYIIYNSKIQEALRIDAIENSCVLLPDDHGVVFPNGFYLQTGESKLFDLDQSAMQFHSTLASPNGEDFLYVFNNVSSGTYILLSYNLIEQEILPPTKCHGYSFFDNGELCVFKAEEEAQNHHAVQIWQTPYEGVDFYKELPQSDSLIAKIGNKELVRAMAECHEVLNLISKEDSFANLYVDILKKSTDIVDSYYWIDKQETHLLKDALGDIIKAASSAIDEFEKVISIKKNTLEQQEKISGIFKEVVRSIKVTKFDHIDHFVQLLSQLRTVRGQVISLKELRYVDLTLVEKYEIELANQNEKLSTQCADFLLKDKALEYYRNKISDFNKSAGEVKKVIEINKLDEAVVKASNELELLIEIVSNLKIEDATQTTKIINSISEIYAKFNQINAVIKQRRKELQLVEGEAVFNSQLKLIGQGMVNYLDISDTAEKCEEYLTKLMIQLEELEGKFSEFDEYLAKISEKRDEIYQAFEARKVSLLEKKNKRTTALQTAANRILKGIAGRLEDMDNLDEINGYLASDLMVDKLRTVIDDLIELGDTVKADDIQSKLKSVQEEAIRQLKDKTELYQGDNLISFGKHKFSVNNQTLDLTIVPRNDGMYFHITGTNFFELIGDDDFNATKDVWNQTIVSENNEVYRSEYLAWECYSHILNQPNLFLNEVAVWNDGQYDELIKSQMASRYDEGYTKGVHDHDARLILKVLVNMAHSGGKLKYSPKTRACASYFWNIHIDSALQDSLRKQIKSAGVILDVFPNTRVFDDILLDLTRQIENFQTITNLFESVSPTGASEYLFFELAQDDEFVISGDANKLCDAYLKFLKSKKHDTTYKKSLEQLENDQQRFIISKSWFDAFAMEKHPELQHAVDESVLILLFSGLKKQNVVHVHMHAEVSGLTGTHGNIKDQKLLIDFHGFSERLNHFSNVVVSSFKQFNDLKKEMIARYKEKLKLEGLKPKVMSSFVRNQLINQVYLPLIGDNLAKQIGTAGDQKRTDLMGMLLLISPPGYGKTTLMEYIASRLGIIFLKINGPSIGHEVKSLDPDDAPNAGAREEIEKLNLGFEMGDNVMIYLDDIQHCHPEFLQKFISLCDGQRKIEGVYKGKTKTYDLRGKKVCVVMAGNPYTESGDKFRIPDMLANRADIYNLGDIIGDSADAFEMSYLENCLTSNTTLRKLSGKSQKDLYTLIKLSNTGSMEGLEFESNHTSQEVNDYVSVLQKLNVVKDIILKVNQQYIKSAAMEDQYRTEPSFKLQGSYRNMNKIAEKIIPIMNDAELKILIMSAYENEAQTLTGGAEANLLKFKEMVDWISEEEAVRWSDVKEAFEKNQRLKGFGDQNQMSMILSQMESLSEGLMGIKDALNKN